MPDIEIINIREAVGMLDVTVELSGPVAADFNVNVSGDADYEDRSGEFRPIDGQVQEFGFNFFFNEDNFSEGDEILLTAQTLESSPEQDQVYHTIGSDFVGDLPGDGDTGSGDGSDGSDGGDIGSITLDSYDITQDGVVNVEWSGSSSTNQSLTGYAYANVDGGQGYDEEFIEGVFQQSGYDSGSVELTPGWGDSGEKSVLIGVRFEQNGEVVKDNEQTTVEIDTGDGGSDGGHTPEPGGALETKYINSGSSNPVAGDVVEITVGYGPVQPSGLLNEWAGDLALKNGNDVIAQEPVTAIDDWKEHTFAVSLDNSGQVELCAEVINQYEEL